MRILEIIDNLNIGGAEKQFREIVKLLPGEDVEVYLYFPCWNKLREIPQEFYTFAKDIYIFNKVYKTDIFKIVQKLNQLIKIVKPHIVHSWLYYSNLINVLSTRGDHKKIISQRFDYRGYFEDKICPLWRREIIKVLDNRTDFLVVNSFSNYNYLISKFKYNRNKVYYIPNGILSKEDFIKKDYEIKNNEVQLLHIGNFRKEKNHFFLIPFLNKLRDICKFKLTLVGDGPLRNNFLDTIKKEGLNECVICEGKSIDAYKIIKDYDIFVYPSISEGMPNALMEALACGIPCVSSDVGGCKDLIIDGENGRLFRKNDIENFTELTRILIEDRSLREKFGNNAVRYIKQDFAISKIVEKYKSLYLHLSPATQRNHLSYQLI